MNFSQISESLYIGNMPYTHDYDVLRELGVKLIINMRVERQLEPDHHDPPVSILWLPTFDSPIIHIPVRTLKKGVAAAQETIDAGGKVYVNCAQGIHRSVAMAAAILISQGYSSQEAMQQIKLQRPQADPDAWYIKKQILNFERDWNKKSDSTV
jgi:protein-tyrosine phosphatase